MDGRLIALLFGNAKSRRVFGAAIRSRMDFIQESGYHKLLFTV